MYLFLSKPYFSRFWGISKTSLEYPFYFSFIKTVSDSNFKNLENFANFANRPELDKVDLLYIAHEMKKKIPLATSQFTNVITEVNVKVIEDEFKIHLRAFSDGDLSKFDKVSPVSESFL